MSHEYGVEINVKFSWISGIYVDNGDMYEYLWRQTGYVIYAAYKCYLL